MQHVPNLLPVHVMPVIPPHCPFTLDMSVSTEPVASATLLREGQFSPTEDDETSTVGESDDELGSADGDGISTIGGDDGELGTANNDEVSTAAEDVEDAKVVE